MTTASTPGFPTWVDLGTADLEDAKRFYSGLFGWTADVAGEEFGGYTTFMLNGRPVAGAGPLYGEGQPTAWSTYIATTNADAIADRVAVAGGKVLVAPFDVLDQGRMAAFLDPSGAPFSVWQAGTMRGAAIFDVPGSLTWNELNTRDLDGSRVFYGSVFGWQFRHSSMGNQPYLVAKLTETPICGIQPMAAADWPVDMPAHWMVYFAVQDCDRTAMHVRSLGGQVLQPPTNLQIGRYAVLEDPQGGMFAILASQG
ncbi:putative enzyme related to lactoylglutathione lyase [Actinoplanes tereljensis]|uniref:Hydroxylase n=1 Tax=Paractinoplanes tereljensis TaxID=571912 RepID=A0A919NK21_9ACTN|nr:VOC family protein [Actinoplanes tereljensis]GIF19913.1 hydroxylase [Actinoplanes tereljensis]